ncbi:LCA5L protein, partial [Eulacestoma nigropectus]|nr:LCA5L protein [Eulacestoma nigropectus]
ICSDLTAGGKKWPAAKTSYLNSSFLTLQSGVVYQDKNATAQRISSARLHKIKELKNEVFDLQRKIEASSLENQALKDLSRRHAKAIDRYNNAESHLQELLAGHRNEMKDLRKLLKMSQEAEKNTARELKKVEAELRKTKGDLKTLLVLSEDKALAEREELNHRLSVLKETLEEKDERIQSLEMQLKLNNSTFSRQLASESKKLLEAGMITKNLLMEIHIVHQKIKEKDRQLYIKNIYANRMPKALRDRSDWVPNDQSTSVQVDKESFRELLLSRHQETEESPIRLKKEKKPSEDKGGEAKAREACSDAQRRKEKQATKKIPTPETSNRTHRGGKLLMEERAFSEFLEEMEKETELLKEELKNLMKTEPNPQSDRVKENDQEGDAAEEAEKEEKKPDEQQKKKARSEGAIPNKDPVALRNKYSISEAIENLHQGLHASGTKPKAGSQRSQRQAGQSCSDTAVSGERISFGAYEPSFGQIPLARQDETSGEQGCSHLTFAERKKHLMKELFGEGCLQGDQPSSSSTRG